MKTLALFCAFLFAACSTQAQTIQDWWTRSGTFYPIDATDFTNTLTLQLANNTAGGLTWTYPGSNGSAGQMLITNGSGVWSYSTPLDGSTFFLLAPASTARNIGQAVNTSTVLMSLKRFSTSTQHLLDIQDASGSVTADIGYDGSIVTTASVQTPAIVLNSVSTYGAIVSNNSGQLSVASANTSGYVLTDNGTGALPTFQAASAPTGFVKTNPAASSDNVVTGSTSIIPLSPKIDNIATTISTGVHLKNTTAATNGARVQYSPMAEFSGSAWQTTGSAAHAWDWGIENEPVNGAATSGANLSFQWQKDGGGWTVGMLLRGNDDGTAYLTLPNDPVSALQAATKGYVDAHAGTGTVTSVSGSGGTTGMTLSGGPITTSGTLTLGGILGSNNGGTGSAGAFDGSGNLKVTFGGTGTATTPIDGNLLIGSTSGGAHWEVASLTAGSGIIVTPSAGGITIAASGGGGTVTNVATNSTLTGGPITTTGTLGLNLANPNAWTGIQTFSANGGGTSTADVAEFSNTTAATSGAAKQVSPAAYYVAQVWNTTATAANNQFLFRNWLDVTSATTPIGTLTWQHSNQTVNPGTFTTDMTLSSAGALTLGAASGSTGSLKINGATSGAVTVTTNSAAGTWTMKMPNSAGSSGQFWQTDGSGNISWATPTAGMTNPMTTTGDMIFSSDNSGTPARRAIGGSNTVIHGGTTPSYSAIVNGDITNSTIDLTTKVTGILPTANGGTNNNSYTAGGLIFKAATSLASTAQMVSGKIVIGNGTGTPQIDGLDNTTLVGALRSVNGGRGPDNGSVGGGSVAVGTNELVGSAVTMPDPTGITHVFLDAIIIVNQGGSAQNVNAFGSEHFNGAAGPYVLAANSSVTFVSDGSDWYATSTSGGIADAAVTTTKTANYTAGNFDNVIPGDATGGAITITLPASPNVGQLIWVTKIDAGINAVSIAPNTGQSIVGIVGNISLPTQGNSNIVVYMGGNKWLSR